ncbi:MAG: glucose-1-phosphate adenylyltransferase [Betaproteobacteria bacterium]|nr:glucose-1-phosphate adenylyltransferase [Betaproteobacteria bacterium]
MQTDTRFVSRLTKSTYALILAGGRGSRLQHLTDWRAKPAVPFGGKFRIIDFVLSNCVNSGIRQIGVATQYKAHSLIRHIQRGWSFLDGRFKEFVDVLPASQRTDDQSWYAGTADAVKQNLDILRSYGPEYVLVLGGDHIYKMDYGKLLSDHVLSGADATVACVEVPVAEATAFGVMGVNDDWRVVEFAEKPKAPKSIPGKPGIALASMGIYVFSAQFLYGELERDASAPGSNHDFGKDIIPYLVKHGKVKAHSFSESCVGIKNDVPYWRDVGEVDAYWEANLDLARVEPDLNLYDDSWPIWTHQEQLPPAKFVFDQDDRRGYAVDSLVSGGCIVSGSRIARSVLFSNVRVHSYGVIEDSVILPEVDVGRGVKLRRCVVDKKCVLEEGLAIGFDPVADAKRFYVTPGGITLVTPDMLGQSRFLQRAAGPE